MTILSYITIFLMSYLVVLGLKMIDLFLWVGMTAGQKEGRDAISDLIEDAEFLHGVSIRKISFRIESICLVSFIIGVASIAITVFISKYVFSSMSGNSYGILAFVVTLYPLVGIEIRRHFQIRNGELVERYYLMNGVKEVDGEKLRGRVFWIRKLLKKYHGSKILGLAGGIFFSINNIVRW